LERAQDRARKATARSFRDRRVVEQARNTLARRSARIAARQATIDAIQNKSQRVSQFRSLGGNREAENLRNLIRSQEIRHSISQEHRPSRRPTELEVLIATFNRKKKLSRAYLEKHCEFREEIYQNASQLVLTGESFTFCATCHSNIKAGRKPKGAISNGLDFPEIPYCLRGLTPLVERLISPRLPFMIIKRSCCKCSTSSKQYCDVPPTSFQ